MASGCGHSKFLPTLHTSAPHPHPPNRNLIPTPMLCDVEDRVNTSLLSLIPRPSARRINPFATLIFDFFLDLALVVTRRRRPRQQKVAQVSVTSCWRLADQGRKNELLGDSCWPAYGLSHTDDPLRHCPTHYATLLFFSFFFFLKSI